MRRSYGKLRSALVLSLCAAGLAGGCQNAEVEKAPQPIHIAASASLEPVAEALISAFAETAPPEMPLALETVPDPDLPAVLEEGSVSAVLRWMEPPAGDWSALLGWTGIFFAVHPDNPVENISSGMIRRLYTGEILSWREAGGGSGEIHVIAYGPENAEETVFEGLFLEGARLNAGASVVPSAGAMAAEIAADPEALGFLWMFHPASGIRILTVDEAAADFAGLISGRYPFRIPVFLEAREPVPPEVLAFAGWVQSVPGQSVLMSLLERE
jgi:ABC-type phosphate transport system substrate-binding protein